MDEGDVVKITNNDPSMPNIDTQFSKECRLKTMCDWNLRKFEEHLGNVTSYGLITGRKYSGKTTIAQEVAKQTNGHAIDMGAVSEEVKKRM